jgi:hypothetical protein
MITRTHDSGDCRSSADYSDCGAYRYALRRCWGPGPVLAYIMLNPSTATEARNDPTIERSERRARALGFDGFEVVNLFAWRETDPAALKRAADPVGPHNDAALVAAARRAGTVIAAWGVHGEHLGRASQVMCLLEEAGIALHHLGQTKAGHPRHPLYISYAKQPLPWIRT